MKDEGKTLDQLLKSEIETETQEAPVEKSSQRKVRQKVPTKPLNVDLPETLMRDLKVISAHNDVTIREIVEAELTRFTKREKKKMLDDLNQ